MFLATVPEITWNHPQKLWLQLEAGWMFGASQVAIHDHSDNSITIGHVADSTAALGSKHGDSWNGVASTRDHKPNLKDWSWWEVDRSLVLDAWTVPVPGRFPSNMTSNTLIHLVLAFQKLRHWHALKFLAQDEKLRIEKAGGRVVFDGYANYRVYAKNARYPGTGGCWSWKFFFFGFWVPVVISNCICHDLHHHDLIWCEAWTCLGAWEIYLGMPSVECLDLSWNVWINQARFFFLGLLRPKLSHDFKGWIPVW